MFQRICRIILSAALFIFCYNTYAQTPITLLLDWFPNPDQAPVFVAQAQGFFKQQGLAVTLVPPANPADPVKLVAAGKAQLAITYQPALVLAAAQKLPIVRIATLIDRPMGCILTQKNITHLNQLQGKTLGYSVPGVDEAMVRVVLKSAGLSLSQVTMINVNYDLIQALLSHRVDAITGAQRNFEPLILQQRHFPYQIYFPEQHGIPSYDEFIIVTNKQSLNAPWISKFLMALQQGMDYLQQHPKQSWQLFAKNYPAANNSLNYQSWFLTLPYFAKNVTAFNASRYANFADFLYQQHVIAGLPSIKAYAK